LSFTGGPVGMTAVASPGPEPVGMTVVASSACAAGSETAPHWVQNFAPSGTTVWQLLQIP
jgi:hypothetical protein